jgi:ABC-type glycerol-3-phosphate transport system substrate-binding protein
MKKTITLALLIISSLLLTACGGGTSETSSDNRDTTSSGSKLLLEWSAPATRTDASPLALSELQGYRVYYGTSPNDLQLLVDLNDSTINDFKVDSIPAGNYYFAVTVYDMDGIESGFSNIINKDV